MPTGIGRLFSGLSKKSNGHLRVNMNNNCKLPSYIELKNSERSITRLTGAQKKCLQDVMTRKLHLNFKINNNNTYNMVLVRLAPGI